MSIKRYKVSEKRKKGAGGKTIKQIVVENGKSTSYHWWADKGRADEISNEDDRAKF